MTKYELTEEHRAQLKPWADKWIANGLNTVPMDDNDRSEMQKAIKGLYEAADLKAPAQDRIVFVPSPMVARFAGGFAASILEARKKGGKANIKFDETKPVTSEAYRATCLAVFQVVGDDVPESLKRPVQDDPEKKQEKNEHWFSSIDPFVQAGRDLNVGKSGFEHAVKSWEMAQGGNFWSGGVAYLSFFRYIAKLPLDYSKYDHWEKAAIHGSYRIMHDDFCMVSDRPLFIKQDEERRPHCENGPYIKWSDGTELFAWRGTFVPEYWIMQKELLSPEDVLLKQMNNELRSAACDIVGLYNVLQHPSLNMKVIDEDEPHIGKLVSVDLPSSKDQWCLIYQCGTGRMFAEAVNDKRYNTALKANAGKRGWRPEMKSPPEHFIPFVRT